jgi:hypothetical protein
MRKMPRSLIRDKRGVSEVAASLMIILVVSIAGTALYSYSQDAFRTSWSSFLLQTRGREERDRERFSIISVWYDNVDQLNLTILNYGSIELAIDAVYVDGTKVTIDEGRGTVVAKNGRVNVKFTSPLPIQDEQTYKIVVASERGGRDVVYWKA